MGKIQIAVRRIFLLPCQAHVPNSTRRDVCESAPRESREPRGLNTTHVVGAAERYQIGPPFFNACRACQVDEPRTYPWGAVLSLAYALTLGGESPQTLGFDFVQQLVVSSLIWFVAYVCAWESRNRDLYLKLVSLGL